MTIVKADHEEEVLTEQEEAMFEQESDIMEIKPLICTICKTKTDDGINNMCEVCYLLYDCIITNQTPKKRKFALDRILKKFGVDAESVR